MQISRNGLWNYKIRRKLYLQKHFFSKVIVLKYLVTSTSSLLNFNFNQLIFNYLHLRRKKDVVNFLCIACKFALEFKFKYN